MTTVQILAAAGLAELFLYACWRIRETYDARRALLRYLPPGHQLARPPGPSMRPPTPLPEVRPPCRHDGERGYIKLGPYPGYDPRLDCVCNDCGAWFSDGKPFGAKQ